VIDCEPLPAAHGRRGGARAKLRFRRRSSWCAARSSRRRKRAASPVRRIALGGGQDHFYPNGRFALATPGASRHARVEFDPLSDRSPSTASHPSSSCRIPQSRRGFGAWAGAFGGRRAKLTIIAGMPPCSAWKARRPMKLRLPRYDDISRPQSGHPFLIPLHFGFDPNGVCLALDLTFAQRRHCRSHSAVPRSVVPRLPICYFLPASASAPPCKNHTCRTQPSLAMAGRGHARGSDDHRSDVRAVWVFPSMRCGRPTLWGSPERLDSYSSIETIASSAFVETLPRRVLARLRREIVISITESGGEDGPRYRAPSSLGISFQPASLNQRCALVQHRIPTEAWC